MPLKSKTRDFIGRDALIRRKKNPMHRFVGLDSDAAVAVSHGDGIYIDRARVGVVTSSMRSPILGKTIALAQVDAAHAALEIGKLNGNQKRLPAQIVGLSHYDPKKARPQS